MTTNLDSVIRRAENIEHWTQADFMRLAPEDKKAELIDGQIIVYPSVFDAHARLYGFLICVVGVFVKHFQLGEMIGCRYAVAIADDQVYEPDLLFVSQERRYLLTREKFIGAPDLVIELVSAVNANDLRGSKLKHYDLAGVCELWLIDPYGPAGTQFYQRQGEQRVEVAPVEGVIHSITLPNFRLKTEWLWPNEHSELPNTVTVLKELGVL